MKWYSWSHLRADSGVSRWQPTRDTEGEKFQAWRGRHENASSSPSYDLPPRRQLTDSLFAGYGEPELGSQPLLAVREDAHRFADLAAAPLAHDEAEVERRVVRSLGRLWDQLCGEVVVRDDTDGAERQRA